MEKQPLILVSFIHNVAVMLEEHAVCVSCCICEEIYKGTVEVTPKIDLVEDRKTGQRTISEVPTHLPLDFPLFLNVVSLADGKKLKKVYPILVKYQNISAIQTLEEL